MMAVLIDNRTQSLLQAVPYYRVLDTAALASVAEEVITRQEKPFVVLQKEQEAS